MVSSKAFNGPAAETWNTNLVKDPKLDVAIRGTGVAAYCSALLLDRAGVPVALEQSERARVPAIMIGAATQALIADIFGRTDLFNGLHRIDKRVVAWGASAEPQTLPHSAVVISEEQLLKRLRPAFTNASLANPQWTIYASRPLPPAAVEHRFGSRTAQAISVRIKDHADPATCWIESVENGWLFLIPHSPGEGWLLSVGHAPLDSSRIIAAQIATANLAAAEFPAYLRILHPLGDAGWLACGTAAMVFDPLCGDGTGNAVREAILAAAVIRASGPMEDVLEHYRRRLLAGFLRHLDQCRQFYLRGHSTDWWRSELQQILTGMNWCQAQVGDHRQFRYRLRDFDLERI